VPAGATTMFSLDRLNAASLGVSLNPERPRHLPSKSCMSRISRAGQEPIVDVDQVEGIEPAIEASEPGRYHVDQIEREPLPSRHTSLRWGTAIKRPDGSVELEPDPWPR
jgi:hypothetical protein